MIVMKLVQNINGIEVVAVNFFPEFLNVQFSYNQTNC